MGAKKLRLLAVWAMMAAAVAAAFSGCAAEDQPPTVFGLNVVG